MSSNNDRYPQADENLTGRILSLVQKATQFKVARRGANESTKALNRGQAELIIIAYDTTPLEIVLHLPLLCEDKNVPFIFVPSKSALGRSCGVSRDVVSIAILSSAEKDISSQISQLRNEIERLIT